jgi:hypothetical protein
MTKQFWLYKCNVLVLHQLNRPNSQCYFTGVQIVSRESLSSYLHCFSMARDRAETVGNEYASNASVDLVLSSLGMDSTAYYSILHTTLENHSADGQKFSFVDMELKFIQLEEHHTSQSFQTGEFSSPQSKSISCLQSLQWQVKGQRCWEKKEGLPHL